MSLWQRSYKCTLYVFAPVFYQFFGAEKALYDDCNAKSFFASVECVERGLNPMTTNLVVADESRTEKTICLTVSPTLKAYGISGRARLFEVVQRVKEVNARRLQRVPGRCFTGSSWNDPKLRTSPELALDYIVAPPRMARFIVWSTKIYDVYLKYVAPEDIFAYSIDEVFMDLINYLSVHQISARELTRAILLDMLQTTGNMTICLSCPTPTSRAIPGCPFPSEPRFSAPSPR